MVASFSIPSNQLRERIDHQWESHLPRTISPMRGMCRARFDQQHSRGFVPRNCVADTLDAFASCWLNLGILGYRLLDMTGTVPGRLRRSFDKLRTWRKIFSSRGFKRPIIVASGRLRPADVDGIAMRKIIGRGCRKLAAFLESGGGNRLLLQSTCFACTI